MNKRDKLCPQDGATACSQEHIAVGLPQEQRGFDAPELGEGVSDVSDRAVLALLDGTIGWIIVVVEQVESAITVIKPVLEVEVGDRHIETLQELVFCPGIVCQEEEVLVVERKVV